MQYSTIIFLAVVLCIFSGCVINKFINTKTPKDAKEKLYKFIEHMPKVELHVHLEGSIKPATLLILAGRNNIELPAKTEADLVKFFKFKDFSHFVEVYMLTTSCLKTIEDYELISYEFGCECARQNIRYAEVTFSIATNCKFTGLTWQQILHGLNKGRDHAEKEFGITWGWVFDILRDEPQTQNLLLEAALNSKEFGVVALGLSGNEDKFNTDEFTQTFETAQKNQVGITPHVGETTGPKSIWDVINKIHVDRIGHGVRCIEDLKLVEYLKQKQIPLEVCLTSNVCIGLFKNVKSHPFKKLWDAGLLLTINSDDPALFNTDLNSEYKILVDNFGFKVDDLEKICLNAVNASFMPEEQKRQMALDFKTEFERLREKLGI